MTLVRDVEESAVSVRRSAGLRRWLLLAVGVVLGGGVVVPSGAAYAAPTVDQESVVADTFGVANTGARNAQSFTVGRSGDLTAVAFLSREPDPDPATLTVHAVGEDGQPVGPALATAPSPVLDGDWVVGELDEPLPVLAGERYAFVIAMKVPTFVGYMSTDVYPGGGCWFWSRSESEWWASPLVGLWDIAFRTWVDTRGPGLAGAPPRGVSGVAYHFAFEVSGAPAPVVRLVEGVLPDGLELAGDGRLHGTPMESGVFPLALEADNGVGEPVRHEVVLEVDALPEVSGPPGEATVGEPFRLALDVRGEPAPELSAEDLPEWLALSGEGVLEGTPGEAGTVRFTVVATNRAGAAEHEVVVHVREPADPGSEEEPGDDEEEPAGGEDDPARGEHDPARADRAAGDRPGGDEGGTLARTGAALAAVLKPAVAALLVGVLLVSTARRRRTGRAAGLR